MFSIIRGSWVRNNVTALEKKELLHAALSENNECESEGSTGWFLCTCLQSSVQNEEHIESFN